MTVGTRGRPPKPTEQKRLLGKPGHHPLPQTSVVIAPALDPNVIPFDGDTEGDRLIRGILAAGAIHWISRGDQMGTVTLLRDGWNERLKLRAAVMGDPPDGLDPKSLIAWFATTRRDLRDLERQITSWLSLLGLTPTDRARLGVAEVKAQSTLERLAAERASQAGRRAG